MNEKDVTYLDVLEHTIKQLEKKISFNNDNIANISILNDDETIEYFEKNRTFPPSVKQTITMSLNIVKTLREIKGNTYTVEEGNNNVNI